MAGELEPTLPESWEIRRLDEVATIIDSLHKTPNYSDMGLPMVRVTDVQSGFLDLSKTLRVSEEVFQEFTRRYAPKKGDLVFSRVGSYGNVSYARTNTPFCLGQNTALISPQTNGRFLHLFLQSAAARRQIEQAAVGSTQKTVSLRSISALQIPIPPPDELAAIASVLGALDDKIEVNRRMNATLEAMARALFQSWFVDFDPVRAKSEGRQPEGMDADTAALFPAEFEESELGMIPKGWKVGSIYEIANVIYGAPFASSLFNSEKLGKPLIRIRDLANESPAVFTTEVHTKGYLLKAGDIAVGMDGEFRAYLWAGVDSWLNQRVCVFAPKPEYSAVFVRNSIIAPLAQVEATETATTVIHLGKNDIDRFTAIIPDALVADVFKHQCQPWYDQIVINKQESRTLAALRDTLLPKLLSGELRVGDAMQTLAPAL